MSDNTAAIASINRQGGTQRPKLPTILPDSDSSEESQMLKCSNDPDSNVVAEALIVLYPNSTPHGLSNHTLIRNLIH